MQDRTPSQGVRILQKLYKKNPQNFTIRNSLINAYIKLDLNNRAIELIDLINDREKDIHSLRFKAWRQYKSGNIDHEFKRYNNKNALSGCKPTDFKEHQYRDCILIRTHYIDSCINELYNKLDSFFGKHIYIMLECYDIDDLNIKLKGNLFLVGKKFITSNKLFYKENAGWIFGDYMLYAFINTLPHQYSYIWMVESDVVINTDVKKLFEKFNLVDDDLIVPQFSKRDKNWGWSKSMSYLYDENVYGCLYPFLRVSNRACHFLYESRISYFAGNSEYITNKLANDEAFTCTTLMNHDFKCTPMETYISNELNGYFCWALPVLREEINKEYTKDKILHPVLDSKKDRKKVLSKIRASKEAYYKDVIDRRLVKMIDATEDSILVDSLKK